MKTLRNRMLALVLVLIAAFVVTGCASKDAASVDGSATPAVQTCPECPNIDKDAVLKEGLKAYTVNYFGSLPSDSNNVKAPDVQKMIDAKTDFLGVDIRSAADYAKGHLPGFINLPFATIGQNIDRLPKDKLIIVQCYTGQTASQTVGVLRMAGYNAKNLHFGFQGVADNNLATVQ